MQIENFEIAAHMNKEIIDSRFEYSRLTSARKYIDETPNIEITVRSGEKELAPITDTKIVKRVLDYSIKLYYQKITFLQKQFNEL